MQVMTKRLRLEGDFDFHHIARLTPGYVGADLSALTKEAAAVAIRDIMGRLHPPAERMEVEQVGSEAAATEATAPTAAAAEQERDAVATATTAAVPLTGQQLASLAIRMGDFFAAVKRVQPSAIREGFATVPGVTWDDVGAMEEIRDELSFAISQVRVAVRVPSSGAHRRPCITGLGA
jgi:ribosome biogenesis ATPase